MKTCLCKHCKRTRKFRTVFKNGSRRQMKDFATELMQDYFYASDKNNWYNAVFDGSWPTAINVLESVLDRLKAAKEEGAQG